jgi:hypothetical protein
MHPSDCTPRAPLTCPVTGLEVCWRLALPEPFVPAFLDDVLWIAADWWAEATEARRAEALARLQGEAAALAPLDARPLYLNAWGDPQSLADLHARLAAVPAAFWYLLTRIP